MHHCGPKAAQGRAGKPLAEIGTRAYSTPLFDASDPIVCHSLALRPGLWQCVWDALERMGQDWAWRQDDPTHATPAEAAGELSKATDSAVFMGCMMIGQVIELAIDCPSWCLECDGTTYLKADYPLLAAVIDPAYEIDSTHFRVPDHLARFALGEIILAQQGGESSVTLTIAEMPAHTHSEQDPGSVVVQSGAPSVALSDPGLPSTTGSTGGGGAHENMPPYETIRKVIIARYPYA